MMMQESGGMWIQRLLLAKLFRPEQAQMCLMPTLLMDFQALYTTVHKMVHIYILPNFGTINFKLY